MIILEIKNGRKQLCESWWDKKLKISYIIQYFEEKKRELALWMKTHWIMILSNWTELIEDFKCSRIAFYSVSGRNFDTKLTHWVCLL